MPGWSRSRHMFIAAVVVWGLAFFGMSHLLPMRPVPRIGMQVILSAALLVYLARLEGWRKFLRETLPFVVICNAAIFIADRVLRSYYGTITGSLYSLLIIVAAGVLCGLYIKLTGAGDVADQASKPSFADIWAYLRARPAKSLSWSEIRAQQRIPKARAVRVKAPDLAGVVEYDSMHFSGMCVEEYAEDWETRLSQVKTDGEGRFALPRISDGPGHCVRVSWPGTQTVHLQLEISPDARPLLVRLKPRKPTAYWPGRPPARTGEVRNDHSAWPEGIDSGQVRKP